MPVLTPKLFNLASLKEAWTRPRPDTWTHGGRDDRWRWQRDLARAVMHGDTARIDDLLADGAELKGPVVIARSPTRAVQAGMSWLTQAVCNNNVTMMAYLLAHGASLNDPTSFRDAQPLLHHALRHDALEAAQWLIDHGASWEGVTSGALFDQVESHGKSTFSSPRCMQAWLGVWNRPWEGTNEALVWAQFAVVDNDPDLLRQVLARTPAEQWSEDQREQLLITVIQFDRDDRLGDLLNAGIVPTSDVALRYGFDMGEIGKQREQRPAAENPEWQPLEGTPWWQRHEEVATPWSWLVIRAGARRIAERWLSVPEEIARMQETLDQEPLVWVQRPASNVVIQNLPPVEALGRLLDLGHVRDAEGNTPLHRWVALTMETPALLEWAAAHHPDWGDVRNHARQTVWEFAQEVGRGRSGQSLAARLHEARSAWDTAVLKRTMAEAAPQVEPRSRPRL